MSKTKMPKTILQQSSVAMQSPAHLKQWLRETGRSFVIFKSEDLIDALPWPEGVETVIALVEGYRQHRLTIPVETAPCPKAAGHRQGAVCDVCRNTGEVIVRGKTDRLEPDEVEEAITFLQTLIR